MNFEDILNQWEEQQKHPPKSNVPQDGQAWRNKKLCPDSVLKKEKEQNLVKNSRPKEQKKVNPMEIYLRQYGVVDKDAIEEKYQQEQAFMTQSEVISMPCEASIDLHGLTWDEGWQKLDIFINECIKRKLHKVLIIHGKGNHSSDRPVLQNMVRTYIEKDYRLGQSGHPDKSLGGKGATWIIIRNI